MAGCPALLLFCRNNQRHWRNKEIFKKRKRIVLVKAIFEKSEPSRSKADSFEQRKTEILVVRRGILGVDGGVGKGQVSPVDRQWEEKQTLLRWGSQDQQDCMVMRVKQKTAFWLFRPHYPWVVVPLRSLKRELGREATERNPWVQIQPSCI